MRKQESWASKSLKPSFYFWNCVSEPANDLRVPLQWFQIASNWIVLPSKCVTESRFEAVPLDTNRSQTSQAQSGDIKNVLPTSCSTSVFMGYWPSVRYWLSYFIACVWTGTRSRSINSQGKNEANTLSHLDRTNLINKGLTILLSEKFFQPGHDGWPIRVQDLIHLALSQS